MLEEYLTNQIENNPAVKEGSAKVIDTKPLKEVPGWSAYIIDLDVTLKHNDKKLHQKSVLFGNGRYITNDLTDIRTGDSLKDKIKPKFDHANYTQKHLLSGSQESKHKIVIFSDPLCPFCRRYVPKAIKDMQQDPKKYAIYYYHLPLPRIHPASVVLVKAMIAAELKGEKVDMLKLYQEIQPNNPKKANYVAYGERDAKKILKVFNKVMGTHLTLKDINSKEVKKRLKEDEQIATDMMVAGTPTVYFDDEYDKTKQKYKSAK
ncbi:hypothetical protein MNB_SM-7-312 [hydrothermal vent metagenome]|uniref:Thioredoxin-like fold domain-containing protein n=1 Tax=hydrothermal vent metagenome TaxID=652676 RepID=A0A1W1BD73_9ZZZZ